MQAYHEVSAEEIASVLEAGLKKTSRGDKGNDKAIIATDRYLDQHRPNFLIEKGVSRDDNVYAYVRLGDDIIDITDGKAVPLQTFVGRSKDRVLELTVDGTRCYVSDLDAYDDLKKVIFHEGDRRLLATLANVYWSKLRRLDQYDPVKIRRPELMIPYNLTPKKIKALH